MLAGVPVAAVGGLFFALRALWPGRHGRARSLGVAALLWLAIPCLSSFWVALEAGHKYIEQRLGVRRLAAECLTLARRMDQSGTWLTEAARGLPALARLRPSYVIGGGNRVKVELHGGFDHYGYELALEPDGRTWVFSWYTETTTETYLTFTDPPGP
jgi:hypothetical protein